MGLFNLFITASVPVLNVLLLTGVGSITATRRIGILGKDATKHLNNVVFFVFNPALVATNLSQTITLESMVLLWFMPVNLLLNFVIGSALGWVVIQITNAPTHLRGVILASCSAGNVGNLLLILVPAMCKEKGTPLGSPDVCGTYGLAYASLSMAIGTILQWSYVYNIVRISLCGEEGKMNNNLPKVEFPEETKSLLPHSCTRSTPEEASTSGCMIIGFIIGVIPQIREAIVGQDAPLRVIQDSAVLLGYDP
ncbi:protein PIN-LIKES 1-like [Phoenix dactylifera]|uniref:Protein PIN-LIKES 1-like n=1 Tax=Phoenix dactylifera TaxID=42345 RepID=A0A8B9AAN5_PHODC|nr:protein PIN-LIKES 1-like [Phoenix dactylifera]